MSWSRNLDSGLGRSKLSGPQASREKRGTCSTWRKLASRNAERFGCHAGPMFNIQRSTFSYRSSPQAPGPTGDGTRNSYGLRASTCYQDVRQGPAHSGLQPSEPRTRKYPRPRFGCPPIYMVAIPNRILTGSGHQAQCLQYPSRYPSI